MDDDGQRYLALIVLILAGVGLWLHSQGKFVGVIDALFKGKAAAQTATQYVAGVDPSNGLTILPQPIGVP